MNILTIDHEEWFHILDHPSTKNESNWETFPVRIHRNTDLLLEMLSGLDHKATFFCLGWITRKYPDVVRKIIAEGHEIACHSDRHQLVFEQRPEQFREDLRAALGSIEEVTGKKVVTYRAPGFSVNESTLWAFDILAEAGIENDSSIFAASRAHGGFRSFGEAKPSVILRNGVSIREFPINTYNVFGYPIVFSGGGYFRLLPYPVIKYMSGRSPYILSYFHPRDFDPGQPVLKDLSLVRRVKSYVGLSGAQKKFMQWIGDFPSIDISTAVTLINWEKAPVVKL